MKSSGISSERESVEYCIHGWFAFLTDHKPSDIIELQIWKLYLYMNQSNFDISDCFVNVVLL